MLGRLGRAKAMNRILSLLMAALIMLSGFPAITPSAYAGDPETEQLLIERGATWKYLDDGSDQGTEWKDEDFDDSLWETDPASFGYGDYDVITAVYSGPDSDNKYITTYFRNTFDVEDKDAIESLQASALIDDGAVFYINGQEVHRENMGSGNLNYRTLASGSPGTVTEYNTFDIAPSLLKNGENTIAVEVHQGSADSDDLVFDMDLTAVLAASGGGGTEPDPEEPTVSYAVYDVALAPGRNATELNVSWYSDSNTSSVVQIAKKSDMTGVEFPEDEAETFNCTTAAAVTGKYSNKAVITGLEESTQYVYRLGDGTGNWSEINNYTTRETDEYSFLLVGDPQIGSSGNAANDTAGWVNTMDKAVEEFPDVSFMMSAGDQVETNNNESQYTGFFTPEELKSLPVATTQGNHDNGINYTYHFNHPNWSTTNGVTAAGGDYSFTYGSTLYMVINSNNQTAATHKQFMEEAIEANPNAKWKVVMFHHSIYSSASHAFDSDILARRSGLFPVFDELDIDVVLMGHDHSYTRSYQMQGDVPQTNQTVDGQGRVVNPTGTLYITANSASGSKYYALQQVPEAYAAVRQQLNTPTFSRVSVTDGTLTISTYRVDTMQQTDTYTIVKGAAAEPEYFPEDVALAPGQNATELNVSWYSDSNTSSVVQIARKSDMTGVEFPEDEAETFNCTTAAAVTGKYSNKAVITGLEESTQYVYRLGDGAGNWSEINNYTTRETDEYSFLLVGDPQIGSSGNAANDTAGWVNTMDKAVEEFPDVSFMMSAGDQVETNNNESQYTGFFTPEELKSLPVATTQGNHDNGVNYTYHFNHPNWSTTNGVTAAGGDYSFTYGSTLYMVINSNNQTAATHKQFMEEAIEANPNAKWKVVMFHHSIYSSASHAFDSDILARRSGLFPVFDELDIDVVLMGHDHSYTRSYQMQGDVPQTNQTVDGQGRVVNPTGTLYITANSASGSKYYALQQVPEAYAAVRQQLNTPTFSRVSVTDDTLTVSTYRVDTMAQTDTYTIVKGTVAEPEYFPEDVALAPGQNATELNVSWYSDSNTSSVVQIARKSDMTGVEFPEDEAETFNCTTAAAVTGKYSNKAVITGLEESTQYVYRLGDGTGNCSEINNYTTRETDEYSFLLVGDPQIGSSGNAANDTAGWVNTMDKAVEEFPDVSFMMSAGDQVETNNNESQYTGFFTPEELKSLPVATTQGNHDNGINYTYHFNHPNWSTTNGVTAAGGDYSFTYGSTLYMVINSNNQTAATHKQFMEEAIEANPNAKWKVVMFHHSIYSSASHAFDSDILARRSGLFPVFDELDIDVVLMGHDHSYTRSYQMLGDVPQTDQTVDGQGRVVNPTGTLYITANSASGSKYYALQQVPEAYAAVRQQLNTPTFSRVSVTGDTLTISTYRVDTMAQTDTYTILKDDTYTPPAGTNYIAAQLKDATDDMEERIPDGSFDFDSSDLEICQEKPTEEDKMDQVIGLRYADLAIPKGATIVEAFIQFTVDEPDKSYNPFDIKIHAEAVPDAAAYTPDVPYSLSTRATTDNYINWKDIPLWTLEHEAGPDQRTPNLAALIQEIVDMDGWNEGNAISFILTGTGNRTAEAFEGGGAEMAPILHLAYTLSEEPDLLPAPGGIKATVNSKSSITLTWDTVTAADGYNVYRSKTSEGTYEQVNTAAITANTYTDNSLSSGTTYYYKVTAQNEAGESPYSDIISAKTKRSSSGGGGGSPSTGTTPDNEQEPAEEPATEPTPEQEPDTTPAPEQNTKSFADVDESYAWAKDAIEVLASRGIINGTSENTFNPSKNITRADSMLLLVKALDIQAQAEPNANFDDVSPEDYYYSALAIAKAEGLTAGTGDNHFNPMQEITREDLMVMAAVALEKTGKLQITDSTDELDGFADAGNVSDYAQKAVAALLRTGVINGSGNGMLNPKGTATRAETATIIYNILNRLG